MPVGGAIPAYIKVDKILDAGRYNTTVLTKDACLPPVRS